MKCSHGWLSLIVCEEDNMKKPSYMCTYIHAYTVVSRKYAPPFAILALVQNRGGGAYTRDATISLVITPSLPGMKLLSVGGGGQALGVAEPEVERCSRR